jgi:hypothetical protein
MNDQSMNSRVMLCFIDKRNVETQYYIENFRNLYMPGDEPCVTETHRGTK